MTYHFRTIKWAADRSLRIGLMLAITGVLSACDVTNPGSVQDEFLADPSSQQGLVNGSVRRLAEAVSWMAYTTALPAREIFPGGQTGAHGHDVLTQAGFFQPGTYGGYFNDAQQARFIAEQAITRFEEVGASDDMLYQAHLWAAYAYRTLGENWCEAVIDGSALQPGAIYFERAIANFTRALALADGEGERRAVRGGRAAAHAWLNQWDLALADAAQLPDDYEFYLNLDQTDQDTENHIYFANANSPYRAYTVWETFYENYFAATGDPRTGWTANPAIPFANAALSGFGQVPWLNQTKFTGRNEDHPLTRGVEMRLLEAEGALVAGNWEAAMDLINAVRTRNVSVVTGEPLEPWGAGSLEEAWRYLKRERGIEMWLEGRRLGDMRRWDAADRPGALDWPDFEAVSPIFSEYQTSLCFDIPEAERDANPNVPGIGG